MDNFSVMLQGLGSVDELENNITPFTDLIDRASRASQGEGGGGDILGGKGQVEPPPGFVAPGAVPVRPDNWDTEAQPHALYRVALGDTLVGLAATYLGDGGRWREIWNVQTDQVRASNTPDSLRVTQLRMPDEARDNLLVWIDRGKPTGTKPGETRPSEVEKIAAKIPGGRKTLIAGAVIGGLGLMYYLS